MDELLSSFDNYIVVVIVGICLCVGYVLKRLVKTDKINRFIPLIMAVFGLGLNIWLNKWSISPEIVLGGILSGLSSTGLHQVVHQFAQKNLTDKSS